MSADLTQAAGGAASIALLQPTEVAHLPNHEVAPVPASTSRILKTTAHLLQT